MAKQTASARRAAKTAKAQAKKAEAKTKRAARAQAKAEKEAKAKALATTKATEIDKLLAQLKSVVDNACERFETDMHDAAELAFRLTSSVSRSSRSARQSAELNSGSPPS
jgi:hypothetical protein